MKKSYFKRILCVVLSLVMAALLIPMGVVALTPGTSGDSIIVDWEDMFGPTPSAGLTFALNSDGTYGVSGLGTCSDTKVILPISYNGKAVTTVQASAFAGKTQITEIVLPNTLTAIGASAFSGCTGLTALTLPDSVVTISDKAFEGCSGLTAVQIPAKTDSISATAFSNCSALKTINVDARNAAYTASGNCVIEKASGTLILGCNGSQIPNDGTVKAIGASAFTGCTGLTEIVVPEGVTSIGQAAFRGCSAVKTVKLPKTLSTVGVMAFNGCSALTDVYYAGTQAEWTANVTVATGNNPLKNATMHYPAVLGDLNEDGVIDENDVSYLRYYLAGWTGYELADATVADFNDDGAVDAIDVALLKRFVAGWAGVELK